MRTAHVIGAALLAALISASAVAQQDCAGEQPCTIEFMDEGAADDGRYYVEAPSDWDGTSALPILVWFHGYQGSGLGAIRNQRLVEAWTDAGYLFVAADGRNNTWAHQGSPSQARSDTAYVRAVIENVQDRYPIDRQRVVAAGFSQGGSMVWSVACFIGAPFSHYAPISGAFWNPLPETCDAGPVMMRHTHGTSDRVVPMEGRPIGVLWHQGDVLTGVEILREVNECLAAPDQSDLIVGSATCSVWSSCSRGGLQLCLHDGGHGMPAGWSPSTQAWIEETVPVPTN
ncbi:MAG: hypothetical protein AAF414_00945 [Pseudomonadota bacterium]